MYVIKYIFGLNIGPLEHNSSYPIKHNSSDNLKTPSSWLRKFLNFISFTIGVGLAKESL